MIDLTVKGLPNAIEVDGKSFLIKTDFRQWIKFINNASEGITIEMLKDIIADDIDELTILLFFKEISEQIIEFAKNPSVTPKSSAGDGTRLFDYVLDGDYIYSSFLQAYGIDLVDVEELHWHKFKALFVGLPQDTKLKEIMGLRGYKKSNVKYETQQQQLKEMWTLPLSKKEQEEDDMLIEEINKEFYNC